MKLLNFDTTTKNPQNFTNWCDSGKKQCGDKYVLYTFV